MPQFTEMRRPAFWDGRRTSSVPSVNGRSEPTPFPARTVVLGYNGSEAARYAACRAAEAAGSGGRVLVVTSVSSSDASRLEKELPLVDEPEQLLQEARALLSSREIEVKTRLAEGDPTEALVAAARESQADLIVVGARRPSFVAHAVRGSVAKRLVASAPCSVLVAR